MKNRWLLCALAAIAMTLGAGAQAAPVTIKIGSFTPPKAKFLREITIPYLRKVEQDSAGAVKFQEFWGGALIRSPRKQWEGMINGIQDASQILPAYTSKLFPDWTIFALPFLFQGTGSLEAALAGWKMHQKGMLGGTEKVHVVAVYTNDNSGLHTNRVIQSIDGLKGLKVRVPGAAESKVVRILGATPVGMSITQVAQSLNRGVIQGTLTGWSALGTFRITPLLKSHVDLPMGVRSFFLGIRKDVYNKVSRKGQDAINNNGGIKLSRAFGQYYQDVGDKMRTQPGKRNVITPSKAQLKSLYDGHYREFHTDWIAKHGKAKYDAMQAILADLRKGS